MNPSPQWIAKMYASTAGRDHLGLGSVSSDQILPTLSPDINVLTFHPRYCSFYTFLLDEFWKRDRPRSRASWVRFYRPREYIFSVGANLCHQPEHGILRNIVGGQKTKPQAMRQLDHYDSRFDYIKSDLGGYGLYYRTVIAQLGLIYPGGPGFPYPLDVPSERGRDVADAFRQGVADTEYYRSFFNDDATQVPIAVIREYIPRACLCQLQVGEARDRHLLVDSFLHHGMDPAAQRSTFRLFLDLGKQTDGEPLGDGDFRQLIYFRETVKRIVYQPGDQVVEAFLRWRLLQAREYYSFALNAMWYYLCHWGVDRSGDIRPIPIAQFWDHLEEALDWEHLAARLDMPSPGLGATSGFQSLLDWLVRVTGAEGTGFDAACTIQSPINEHRLHELALENRTSPVIMTAGMVTMLGLIYLRFGRPDRWLQEDWAISRMGSDGRLSVDAFVRTVRDRLQGGFTSILDLTRRLYADYIILQHQLVATRKLPDNTFRFRRDGDHLRFFDLPNRLAFMNSRFDAISTTVHELGLIGNMAQPQHPLTPDGERLLAAGDLE